MEPISEMIAAPLGWLMRVCYLLAGNYGLAIILFTLLTKVILLPVSIWVQKNSIKMVEIQPEINYLKVKFFGDQDRIADGQAAIFKKYKYSPFASIIPLLVQLGLLILVVKIVYNPLDYILHLDSGVIAQLISKVASIAGLGAAASTIQLSVVAALQNGLAVQGIAPEALRSIVQLDLSFMGFNLAEIPSMTGGMNLWSPVIAGVSAWLLCEAQNRANVLQAEQSKWNKYGMMAFSIGLSLYLGYFVPTGVGLYWTASNLMAIAQLYLLNWWIDPKKHVDYAALEASKAKLAAFEALGEKKKLFAKDPNSGREKADYKRFFSIANKHLVFYSESSGFYKYYKGMIEKLLEISNVRIHYITSDPDDNIFEMARANERIKAYYIGHKRLITLMMKMDADIVVMTMPDLENMHIKRSYLRKDIEYIYVPHGMDSLNLTMRTGSLNNYDTVFCVGPHQKEEIEKTEQAYTLRHKNLVEWGYGLLDEMRREYAVAKHEQHTMKRVLIAPSWQEGNIMESCLQAILQQLKGAKLDVIVRPHPQQVRHYPEQMAQLQEQYSGTNIVIQTDFASNATVFEADLMITDWSAIAYEYAYTTLKPVLFVNTPMKIMNPEYQRIDTVPINVMLRDEIGRTIETDRLEYILPTIMDMLSHTSEYESAIEAFVSMYVYNLGRSDEIAAKYILKNLQKKTKKGVNR